LQSFTASETESYFWSKSKIAGIQALIPPLTAKGTEKAQEIEIEK
jgi:hypothetical protein